MKARLTKLILSVFVITFTLTGCSKDEGIISSTASSKQDILTFATIDEFNETLQKVNSMKPEERIAWEKEQGFKSYGTICDEFYKTVNPESFKNIDEVKIFVKKNSDKIELYTSSDGEIYCITKYFKNPKRYLLNKDKQYKIGLTIMNDEIGRESNCDSASNSLGSQKVSSAVVTSDEIIQNSIYNGVSYRMHIWINTYNHYEDIYSLFKSELRLANFKKLLVWWYYSCPTAYKITLNTADDVYGLIKFSTGENTIVEDIDSKYIFNYDFLVNQNFPINTNPHLVSYSILADNIKGCTINQSKTY